MEIGEYIVTLDDHWEVSGPDGVGGPRGRTGVVLPDTVVPLSWGEWDPASWEKQWFYERDLTLPPRSVVDATAGRWFLEFDGVASAVSVWVNDVHIGEHLGGYLPARFDVTGVLSPDGNRLVVAVDSTFTVDAPPNVVDADSSVIDFWQPGGIYRSVRLRLVPRANVADLVVGQVDILGPRRRLDVTVSLAGPVAPSATVRVELIDTDGVRVLARDELPAGGTRPDAAGGAAVADTDGADAAADTVGADTAGVDVVLHLDGLAELSLWDVDRPVLYTVRAQLVGADGRPTHSRTLRTGFREAVFRRDGFFLNGRRLSLRGANRHQLYPWTGFAMPDRVQRRDARILREDLNCVMVRCSHYPQSAAFLDACDELGLLVWAEPPGWQHIGGPAWQDRGCRDLEQLIRRDRHRPSIVVWGARFNEMPDDTALWSRTEAIAKRLDPTRATSGTMHAATRDSVDFQHDVFAYDDYTTTTVTPNGTTTVSANVTTTGDGDRRPVLLPPREPWPYLIAEAVSQRSSPTMHYLRTDPSAVAQHQALDYAVALDAVAADDRYAGLLAWVAFDYQTGFPGHRGVKRGGLADVFRIPKPGAALYRSQVDPAVRPVLEPAFAWGSGPGATTGPGRGAVLCANVDRVEVHLDGVLHSVVEPDRAQFPHLAHPPSFIDLPEGGSPLPELRLDGYVDGRLVVSRSFSADPAADGLLLRVDDPELIGDGSDATRVVVGTVDRYGNLRAHGGGVVEFAGDGPATLVGDNPFDVADLGGIGAVWLRSRAGAVGPVTLRATLGSWTAEAVVVVRPSATV